ncbi:Hsp33 family molecular chaperone HslO [Alkalilimnicola ehrlichii MLHE-1]|uniref:33 kDa chaperonin n=1 Tax=Alkalilimnicola ehrlichii (strain ATCC BAA-1101 / DSM 17681 / MLHE-1) TaxID=187272 RepID=Q0ACB7_ALKEH|nr:Hsp33 family molecular chaperone HslO [Alkalilimnicola ehrlichii]ABI55520.1 Hsp33 protein [Alkalilimnicola ehrlichii MLHE-1]
MTDHLHRFIFEHASIRGELVQLSESYREVLRRRPMPEGLARLTGEAMAAGALLVTTLKFKGQLSLQFQGDGPVGLLLVQVGSDGGLRATARWNEDANLPEPGAPLDRFFGQGHLAITIEPKDEGERYQGLVGLGGGRLAEAVEGYFRDSEQLDTRIWLSSDSQTTAGLLLQRLPGEDPDPDAWNRAGLLADTLTMDELRNLDAGEILRRLFHEEDLRLFDPTPFRFHCNCSRERISHILLSMGEAEIRELLREQGTIETHCQFCNAGYRFDAVDIEQLFSDKPSHGPQTPPTQH